MINYKHSSRNRIIKAKDIVTIILVIIPFTLIDPLTALFIGAILSSFMLMRRVIQHINPDHISGYSILRDRKELIVPQKISVFELSNTATMEILYTYAEILRIMAIHPGILIIRFRRIVELKRPDADILKKVIKRLSEEDITILFSDVNKNLEMELKRFNLPKKDGGDHIFFRIKDAIDHAEKMLSIR